MEPDRTADAPGDAERDLGPAHRIPDSQSWAAKPRCLTRKEAIELLTNRQRDPGLEEDLARLAGDTTDDLGPIR